MTDAVLTDRSEARRRAQRADELFAQFLEQADLSGAKRVHAQVAHERQMAQVYATLACGTDEALRTDEHVG